MGCPVEVSASIRSLVQRSPNECGVSEWDCEALIMRRLWPTGKGGCYAMANKKYLMNSRYIITEQTGTNFHRHDATNKSVYTVTA